MATTAAPLHPNIFNLRLGDLVPSSTNRTASDAAIREMTESVQKNGVLQPIVVRPLKGAKAAWEIICGEVRWRAATAAKLETIPALVRSCTDQEAQAMQIIENLQRSNPGPLDEARAYDNLRKLMGKAATIEAISAQVGKDAPYVAQRLKLLDLSGEGKKALEAGVIGIGHGLLLAPLQEAQQKAALKWLGYEEDVEEGYGGMSVQSVHSVTALSAFIARTFMLTLANAPFDTADAKLLPKMGACTVCPHNTATSTNLFPDLKDATCTLPSCFFQKRDLALDAKIAEIKKDTGKVPFRLGLGDDYENRGPAKIKVDGYLATEYYENGPRIVKGEPCKTAQTAILVFKSENERKNKELVADIGMTATICAAADCPKHGKRGGSISGSTGRVALKGMAFVEHKEGNLKKSLPERIRFAVFKALAAKLIAMETPPFFAGVWTDRIQNLAEWGNEQLGYDAQRDAVKALDLWPKEKKASEMDWDATLKKHFAGKPWAWAMAVLAVQDIRNPYHEHGEKTRRYPGESKTPEHMIFYLAKSFKVDVGKIADELKAADKVQVDGMAKNAKAREAAAKSKPKAKGTKVVKSGPKAKVKPKSK